MTLCDILLPKTLVNSTIKASGATVGADGTLTFTGGFADNPVNAGDIVTLYRDGVAIGQTTVSANATVWTIATSSQEPSGSHIYTAVVKDASNNVGGTSTAFDLTIDAVDPTVVSLQFINVATGLEDTLIDGTTVYDVVVTFSEKVALPSQQIDLSGIVPPVYSTAWSSSDGGLTWTARATYGGNSGSTTMNGVYDVIVSAATATDLYGNLQSVDFTKAYSFDTVAPTFVSASFTDTSVQTAPAVLTAVFTFSEQMSAVAMIPSAFTATNASVTSVSEVSGSSGTQWLVTLTPSNSAGSGAITVVVDTAEATDEYGNAISNSVLPISRSYDYSTAAPAMAMGNVGVDAIFYTDSTETVMSFNEHDLRGTVEAGATISLTLAGSAAAGTATADASGVWTYSLTAGDMINLGEGSGKNITATVTDPYAHTASTSMTVSVDSTTIDFGNQGTLIHALASGGQTYYQWDRNSDGLITTADKATRVELESLFFSASATPDTDSNVKYNGVSLILPLMTDLQGISGLPASWGPADGYWSSTLQSTNVHHVVTLATDANTAVADTNAHYVAFYLSAVL